MAHENGRGPYQAGLVDCRIERPDEGIFGQAMGGSIRLCGPLKHIAHLDVLRNIARRDGSGAVAAHNLKVPAEFCNSVCDEYWNYTSDRSYLDHIYLDMSCDGDTYEFENIASSTDVSEVWLLHIKEAAALVLAKRDAPKRSTRASKIKSSQVSGGMGKGKLKLPERSMHAGVLKRLGVLFYKSELKDMLFHDSVNSEIVII